MSFCWRSCVQAASASPGDIVALPLGRGSRRSGMAAGSRELCSMLPPCVGEPPRLVGECGGELPYDHRPAQRRLSDHSTPERHLPVACMGGGTIPALGPSVGESSVSNGVGEGAARG